MFQYAAGLALSIEHETSLAITIDMFEGYTLHQGFELERVFGLNIPHADATALRRLIGWRSSPPVRRILAKVPTFAPLCGEHFLAERADTTVQHLHAASKDTYLHGYWQSSRFFDRHADRVRASLAFVEPPSAQNIEVLAEIAAGPSASVHIRRGDYLSSKNAAIYNCCPPNYFLSSMELLQNKFDQLKFFIFSDDPTWASEFFANQSYNYRIIDHNKGPHSYNDIRLMSACDHHIIANSTFSWWGAWLNPKVDKFVIAPRLWTANTPSSRVIPETWLTL